MITGYEFAERLFSEGEYEERLYSTGDEVLDELLERAFCDGYEFAQYEFSKDSDSKKKHHKIKLEDSCADSHRGLGRAAIIGGVGGVVGRMAGKRAASKADSEGDSEEEVLKKATKRSALVGGLTEAGVGAIKSLALSSEQDRNLADISLNVLRHGALGSLGALWGARKNTKKRISNRHDIEERMD